MHKLGIIVPVYRSKNYILDCIDSIYNQLDDHSNVIIIDDGCPEGSLNHLLKERRYVNDSERFHLLRQVNKGVSATRNIGINYAKTIKCSHIAFVDSDDFLFPYFFDVVNNFLTGNRFDILEFEYCRVSTNTSYENFNYERFRSNTVELVERERLLSFIESRWHLCRRVFSISLFENVSLEDGLLFEDMALCLSIYSRMSLRILHTDSILYAYRVNPLSITRSKLDGHLVDLYKKSFLCCLRIANDTDAPHFSKFHVCYTAATYGIDLDVHLKRNVQILLVIFKHKKGAQMVKMIIYFLLPKLYVLLYKKMKRFD